MKTKRLLIMAAMAVLSFPAIQADDGVILMLRSGRPVSFAFVNRPVMVTGSELEMHTADGATLAYSYADIEKVVWGDIDELTKAVGEVAESTGGNIVFRIVAEGVKAEGMKKGEKLTAYSVDGKRIGSASADGNTPTFLPLPEGKGVYILRTTGGVSYKISK